MRLKFANPHAITYLPEKSPYPLQIGPLQILKGDVETQTREHYWNVAFVTGQTGRSGQY